VKNKARGKRGSGKEGRCDVFLRQREINPVALVGTPIPSRDCNRCEHQFWSGSTVAIPSATLTYAKNLKGGVPRKKSSRGRSGGVVNRQSITRRGNTTKTTRRTISGYMCGGGCRSLHREGLGGDLVGNLPRDIRAIGEGAPRSFRRLHNKPLGDDLAMHLLMRHQGERKEERT
jgi:hypothetical protein